eukprot:scaffold21788_cov31-Tisochrysis_lutea.AAC.4
MDERHRTFTPLVASAIPRLEKRDEDNRSHAAPELQGPGEQSICLAVDETTRSLKPTRRCDHPWDKYKALAAAVLCAGASSLSRLRILRHQFCAHIIVQHAFDFLPNSHKVHWPIVPSRTFDNVDQTICQISARGI